jgi:ABC-type glycerol-3-phosphate transport system substrate-binding protein
MFKKVTSLFLVAALVGTLAVGCGKENSASSSGASSSGSTSQSTASASAGTDMEGEITFSSNRTDLQNTLLKEFVTDFNKVYPNIKVNIETIKDYQATIKVKMSSNDLPDVWTVHNGYYTKDQLATYNIPLDGYDFTKDFLYSEVYSGSDGKIYALPQGASATGVVYNKKIFKELGITVPQTLDEFIAAGKKITESGRVGLATAAKAGWPLQYYWLDIANTIAGDGSYKNSLATKDEPFTADSPMVKAYTLLKTFKDAGILEKDPLSADWEPMKKDFRDGKVGMFILGPWFIPQALDPLTMDDIGFFPLPYDNEKGAKKVSAGPDVGLGMSKNTKNQAATEAFFKFMMDTNYANVGKSLGLLTSRKSIEVDLPFAKEFESYNPQKLAVVSDSKELTDTISKGQIDYNKVAQEVLMSGDVQKVFDELNSKWKKARSK